MPDTELTRERAHVDRAAARLEALIAGAESRLQSTLAESSRHGATLADRDVFVHRGIHHLDALRRGSGPLCFGRIDLTDGQSLVIGRTGISDENGEPLVVDWRARAAAPFYRATGLEPQGVVRRRHFLWRNRTVVGLDDELLDRASAERTDLNLVGEGALLRTLDAERTARMGDIVATIQREQHEIIHAPLAGVLVVQGGPGTGKTAVALHRAAYLLYAHRFPLERQGVLFVGPNRRFLDYISDVLPSLGEDAARLITPTELVAGLMRTLPDDPAVETLKHDARMAAFVAKAVANRQRALRRDLVVPYGPLNVVLSAAETQRLVAAVRAMPGTHNERALRMRSLVVRALGRKFEAAERRLMAAGMRGAKEEVSDHDKALFSDAAARSPQVGQALRRMWPALSGDELVGYLLASPARIAAAADGVLDDDEIGLLVAASSERASRFSDADVVLVDEADAWLGPKVAPSPPGGEPLGGLTDGERFDIEQVIREQMGEMDPEMEADIVARLTTQAIEARGDVGRGSMPASPDDRWRRYGHVIVDEAQDLSPMQWRMIARRASSLSMTLVGDLAQGTSPWSARSWSEVIGHIGAASPLTVRDSIAILTIGYRTPSEVMDYAAPVLVAAHPDLTAPRSVRTSGVEPTVLAADGDVPGAVRASVARALGEVGEGTIGVICPPDLVAALADGLADSPQITVLDPVAAKGLEFDAVIVVEPSTICSLPGGLSALYIGLTRPTRSLTVVHSGDLPPPLRARVP